MGIRGELYSTKVILQNRSYFFNVKENRLGDLYLNIVESKNRESGGFERQSVIVFADDLQVFLADFDKALQALERAVREQKKKGRAAVDRPPRAPGADRGGGADKGGGAGSGSGEKKRLVRKPKSSERRDESGDSRRAKSPGAKKRVVVRKKPV